MILMKDIDFGFGGRMLMEKLSLHVRPQDRVGLVGPNGVGKTTLLRIISGEIEGFTGAVTRRKGLTVGLLPQDGIYDRGRTVFEAALDPFADLIEMERQIETQNAEATTAPPDRQEEIFAKVGALQHEYDIRGGFTFRARTEKILSGLGFPKEDLSREISTLSGGWQMRVALAKLLLMEPGVLLLDEPTNHLDLPALIWFENYLQTYTGAVVLISHDRAFLDRVADRVAEFNMRKLELYSGNYSYYEIEKQKRLEILQNRADNQDREIKRTERFIERFRYKNTKARQVQSRIKMLDKIERIELPSEARTLHFSFKTRRKSGQLVMELTNVAKSYGEKQVLSNVNLKINRGDRIAIIGANGLGKSTLMRVLADRTEFTGEKKNGYNVTVNYFSQDQYELLSPDKTVLDEATAASGEDFEGNIRTLLGVFLFHGADVDKKVAVLSGGEKSRLLLARMMANPSNFLLLDEPTNHLDPPSRDMLEDVLLGYDGTLCFVSHDRYFINGIANKIIEITASGIEEFMGNYEDYEIQKRVRADSPGGNANGGELNGNVLTADAPNRRDVRRERAKIIVERSRALKPIRDEFSRLEEEIHSLETRAAEIEAELAVPETYNDADKARTLPSELKSAKSKLVDAMEQWESLGEELAEKEKEFELPED